MLFQERVSLKNNGVEGNEFHDIRGQLQAKLAKLVMTVDTSLMPSLAGRRGAVTVPVEKRFLELAELPAEAGGFTVRELGKIFKNSGP